ncbi:MAG: type II secretion system GspH family protein [Planctomycetota bacterium]|nr:type II secretion system GspH family protein [Planctomycetota bacterium]
MKTQKKSGFTLIEMLIVVAIIGILAALLSGPLMRARRTAQLTGCTNNLHQIGLTVAAYTTQLMPGSSLTFANMAEVYKVFNGIDVPPQIFHCPVDQDATQVSVGTLNVGRISYDWASDVNVANMPSNRVVAADVNATVDAGNATNQASAAPHYADGTTVLYGSNQVRRWPTKATADEQGIGLTGFGTYANTYANN